VGPVPDPLLLRKSVARTLTTRPQRRSFLPHMGTEIVHCACVDIFLIPKSSVIMCGTLSLFTFSSSAISLKPFLRSERTKVHTLPTSWVMLHILSAFLEPPTGLTFRLHCYQSAHKTCSLSAVPDSSHSIQRTHTACSAAWKRTVHWVCSSCTCELEHVQTYLGT
jgi:hypothetical protein